MICTRQVWSSLASSRGSDPGDSASSRDQLPSRLYPRSHAHVLWRHCHSHERDQGESPPCARPSGTDPLPQFLKQANGLDLGKLLAAYYVYYKVIYDQISVLDASTQLDELMVAPPKYKLWQQLIIGGLASALIQPSGEFPFYFQRDAINSIVLHQHSTVRSSTVSSVSPSAHSSSSYKSVSLATTYTPVSSSACPLFHLSSHTDPSRLQNRHRYHQRLPRRCIGLDSSILFRRRRIRFCRPHSSRLHRPLWISRARQQVHHIWFRSSRLLDPVQVSTSEDELDTTC